MLAREGPFVSWLMAPLTGFANSGNRGAVAVQSHATVGAGSWIFQVHCCELLASMARLRRAAPDYTDSRFIQS